MESCKYVDPSVKEEQLSENDVLLREQFVEYYLYNYNAYDACLKLGFLEPYAVEWAKVFMADNYVRRLIQTKESEGVGGFFEEVEQRTTYALMKQVAAYRGPGFSHAAAQKAVAKMGDWLGMGPRDRREQRQQESLEHRQGGVMLVPAFTTSENWADYAIKSQGQLKESVRD